MVVNMELVENGQAVKHVARIRLDLVANVDILNMGRL